MKIKIDFTKSAQENANEYYAKAKKLALKKEGAEKAIKELQQRLSKELAQAEQTQERRVIVEYKKEWYEKFHWFNTTSGMLVIGGRDAKQNEILNSKHFEDGDLFFHADIFGAPVTILKGGAKADQDTKEEVAQFAACYSSTWEKMLLSVDVYAMRREQVSKSTSKGSLGTGSFLLKGEREWFRNVPVSLVIMLNNGSAPRATPMKAFQRMKPEETENAKYVVVSQGSAKKSDAAKQIAKAIGFDDIDFIMQLLPTGTFKIEMQKRWKPWG
jgi:predicted ribosome quality control (RQC) complex YloA/Tae2 family protein